MDDLMNKVGALIEEYIEGETEARGLIKARNDTERLKGELRVQTQHSDLVSSTLETVRDILGAPPGAEFATDAARRVVKERDALRQMLEQLHRELDEKLFEVRNAVGEKAPAVDNERHYEGDELEGFRVGDLVQLRGMHPSHARWQTVTKLEEDGRVRYAPCDAYAPHMIARKPIEAGDAVRWKNEATRRDSRGMAKYVVTRVDDRHCWFGGRSAELCDVIAIAP